jgi:formate hydrogenlyase subunit 6/NADH:ubiquinone oxidoreductase subunit I
MIQNFRIRADLTFDSAKCTGCAACTLACPTGAIQMLTSDGFVSINYDYALCLYCRRCSFACPEKAINYGGALESAGFLRPVPYTEEKVRVELQVCDQCGSTLAPRPLVKKAEELLRSEGIEMSSLIILCQRCRVGKLAKVFRPLLWSLAEAKGER